MSFRKQWTLLVALLLTSYRYTTCGFAPGLSQLPPLGLPGHHYANAASFHCPSSNNRFRNRNRKLPMLSPRIPTSARPTRTRTPTTWTHAKTSSRLCMTPRDSVDQTAVTEETVTSTNGLVTDESPPPPPQTTTTTTTQQQQTSVFDPELRRVMTSVATLGVLETAFLTYSKLKGPSLDICGTAGDCASVLNGPYSVLPFTNNHVPLATLGFIAYLVTAYLAIEPVVFQTDDTNSNRIALLAVTTAMATFSVYLMSLVYGVLQTSCLFCLASAVMSISLAAIAWLGGWLPQQQQQQQHDTAVSGSSNNDAKLGIQAALTSFLATTVAAVVLFVFADGNGNTATSTNSMSASLMASSQSSTATSLLASSSSKVQEMSPPPITTTSSERALLLSKDLQSLHAKMYGAYWCSHCFDQKQTLGKQAFANIQYMECAPEGTNSQRDACKKRDVPGYPTWEIDGKLYPGERELDELEDIVKEASGSSSSSSTAASATP